MYKSWLDEHWSTGHGDHAFLESCRDGRSSWIVTRRVAENRPRFLRSLVSRSSKVKGKNGKLERSDRNSPCRTLHVTPRQEKRNDVGLEPLPTCCTWCSDGSSVAARCRLQPWHLEPDNFRGSRNRRQLEWKGFLLWLLYSPSQPIRAPRGYAWPPSHVVIIISWIRHQIHRSSNLILLFIWEL